MRVLVVYDSRHGATRGIAERIAATLSRAGVEATLQPAAQAGDPGRYDAVVIGSAVYFGSWLKEAAAFVRRNRAILANQPVWLFSSGPIGADTTDDQGRDMRGVAEPKQIAEFREALQPRDHRVFFGQLDRDTLRFVDRLVASLPAFPGADGDFRDWQDIESWAERIAEELAPAPNARSATQ